MLDHSLDRVFHALSDPTRRRMIERLARNPASVSDLAAPFEMSFAAVVQHVQVLEDCGVIRSKKTGRTRICQLDTKRLSAAEKWFGERRALWEKRLDALGDLVEASSTSTSKRKK